MEPIRTKFKTLLLTGLLSTTVAGYLDALGIVGGSDLDNKPYAVLVTDLDGTILPITGLPTTGDSSLSAVDINLSGLGLLGGRDDSAAYASFVQSDGTLIPITLSIPTGEVFDLAINTSGLGLLGVRNISLNHYFATFVTSEGTVTPVQILDRLFTVDLNDAGVGLVGGEGGEIPFASYVTSDMTVTPISLPFLMASGHTSLVAINNSGAGILAAVMSGTYAGFVYPDNTSLQIPSFPTSGTISSVAINNSGIGLIGGNNGSGSAYAGLVALDGNITDLILSPFEGNINSVSLNDSGMGLIGGIQGSSLYTALIAADRTLTSFTLGTGQINSVAITEEGVGLIGGQLDSSIYAALVAPNGTFTRLNLTGNSISSVAIASLGGEPIINQVAPTSAGPYLSVFYNHLAASSALGTRFTQQNRVWAKNGLASIQNIAQNGINFNELQANLAIDPKVEAMPKKNDSSMKRNSFWFEPFGDLVYLNKEGSIPKYSNQVAGGLVGYDRQGENYIIGASGGYAYNYVNITEGVGHATIQEEVFSIYGLWYKDHFWMALAFSGGPYQVTNTRHFLHSFTSKGKFDGWVFDPHVEMASPRALDQRGLYYVEPFFQLDWVNNWQDHYTERGATGFNLEVPSTHNSLLQSEAGLRFYEQFLYGWGKLCLEQKVSYINQAPFDINPLNVSFVSSPASFPVALASSNMQNLGAVQLMGCFVPKNPGLPYGGFSFQGTGGSAYQSYWGSLFMGIDF